jgi:hypothetical protein
VTTKVSRQTIMILLADGTPACAKCARRPRRPRPPARRNGPRRWWPDCRVCHAAYERAWRAEGVHMKLTAAEAELILELRQAKPAGKHHAG